MFEHVGQKYWRTYFDTVKRCLKPGGSALVQCITLDDHLFETLGNTTGFMEEYIFPGGMLPSKTRFRKAATGAGLVCRELYGFGQDYAETTSRWLSRFEASLDEVKALGYDERFVRMWRFYLSCCIASFRSRRTDVMQAHLTRPPV
jgi:cyclopropane-fatty-acyl-phospholipid synthase